MTNEQKKHIAASIIGCANNLNKLLDEATTAGLDVYVHQNVSASQFIKKNQRVYVSVSETLDFAETSDDKSTLSFNVNEFKSPSITE